MMGVMSDLCIGLAGAFVIWLLGDWLMSMERVP